MKTETVPTTTDFKFNCPSCGQHILVTTEWSGLGIRCPSCQSRFTVPSPSNQEIDTTPTTSPEHTGQTIRIELSRPPGRNTQAQGSPASRHSPGSAQSLSWVRGHNTQPAIGKDPWSDLGQRLEKGVLVEPAELATALFQELISVRRRLERLEKQMLWE